VAKKGYFIFLILLGSKWSILLHTEVVLYKTTMNLCLDAIVIVSKLTAEKNRSPRSNSQ
jgi:hypothetical protein